MRYTFATAAAVIILVAGCAAKKFSTQIYTATTDADGTLHAVQLELPRAARVTCVSAVGHNHGAAKCNVNGASLAPSDSVVATDKLYLFCEGTAPLRCTAKVE